VSAEISSLTMLDAERLEVAVRRGTEITRYTFTRVPATPSSVIDYEWQFQHDFWDFPDAFKVVLEAARRALHDERPEPPILLQDAADGQ